MNRILYNFVFAFLAFLIFIPYQAAAQTSDDVRELRQLTQRPEPADQIEGIQSLLDRYPDWINAKLALGVAYYRTRSFEQVIPLFSDVVRDRNSQDVLDQSLLNEISESLAAAYNEVAREKIRSQRYLSAKNDLLSAIELFPDAPTLAYNLGICYYHTAEYQKAEQVLAKTIQRWQDSPADQARAWYYLGRTYDALGQYQEAIAALEKTIALDDKQKGVQPYISRLQREQEIRQLLDRAKFSMTNNSPHEAIEHLRKVLSYDPNHIEADHLLKEARKSATYIDALDAIRDTRFEEALAILGQLPKDFKDVRQQVRTAQQGLRQQSKATADAEFEAALAYYDAGKYSRAIRAFDNILRRDPSRRLARFYRQRADSALNKVSQEEEARKLAAAKPPEREPEIKTPDTTAQQILASADSVTPILPEDALATKSGADTIGPEVQSVSARGFDLVNAFLIGAVCLLILAGGVYIWNNQRSSDLDAMISPEPVINPPYQEEPPAVPLDTERTVVAPSDDAGFEEIVDEEQASQIVEIIAKDEPEEQSEVDPDEANVFSTVFSEHDDNDFMSLVDSEEMQPQKFDDDGDDSDSTRTVDMSQFQLKKIGRYIIEKEIGRGAAGRVYKAWDPKLDRTVVIKTVSYSLTATAQEIKRMKGRVYREARAAAKLSHPNIVIVYDVEDEASFSYIVMEYIEGPDLRSVLDKERRLDPLRATHFVLQTCHALHFAHKAGIVHRDIKPSNMLIVEEDKVKVTDFGIAKVTNNMTLTQTGRVVGTPSYMAPEQIEGGELDGRADVFSLGVVLYELLTGERPFSGDSLPALAYKIVHVDPTPASLVNVELPEAYDEIIRKAMAKNPKDRFKNTREFQRALKEVQASLIS